MSLDALLILAAGTESGDGNIFKQFGVHWAPFIAQLVNFFIVCLVLKKFAYGPVMNMLGQRRQRIADGEAKLEEVERQIAESEKRTREAIQEANDRAKRLVEEAKASASAIGEKKTQEATAAAQAILAKADEAAKSERDKMHAELKKEFGRLVTATTAQVTGKVLTDDDQRRINQEALAKVEG
nr:F0F1 ATP synthase subunit B [Desulfuromonadales bacterium]